MGQRGGNYILKRIMQLRRIQEKRGLDSVLER